jgi:hypothetical protein
MELKILQGGKKRSLEERSEKRRGDVLHPVHLPPYSVRAPEPPLPPVPVPERHFLSLLHLHLPRRCIAAFGPVLEQLRLSIDLHPGMDVRNSSCEGTGGVVDEGERKEDESGEEVSEDGEGVGG